MPPLLPPLLLPEPAASDEVEPPEEDPLPLLDGAVDVDVGDVLAVPIKPESSPVDCALPPSPLLDDPPRHAGSEKSPRTTVETPAFKIRFFTSHLVSASRTRRTRRLMIRAVAVYHHIVALIPKTFSSGGKPLFGGCGVTPLLYV
jgi:hypothetical protein